MIKRTKLGATQWLKSIKEDVLPRASIFQPYNPIFMPWALKHRKKFYCDSKSPSFKHHGGKYLFLLDRAREAYEKGDYIRGWLDES